MIRTLFDAEVGDVTPEDLVFGLPSVAPAATP
jgi:hypothetical protein